jgi:glyoxylase-like metal-dependent hydrolase (beta-lactamase superfamily II)
MEQPAHLGRRAFLVRAGQGSIALAVLTVSGCGPTAFSTSTDDGPSGSMGSAQMPGGGAGSDAGSSPVSWYRADLGFVSAYVLVRAGEAAVVDTGVEDSEGSIEAALTTAGLGWDTVGHVILTHRHGDHIGSLDAVLASAPSATAYAGAADIPKINASKAPRAVGDGDRVFGLRIVATPGHTLGHIAAFDEAGGLLVAGDALRTVGGTLGGSNPDFTEDVALARATIAKLGGLRFETLLVGHGDPILAGAAAQVAALAAAG